MIINRSFSFRVCSIVFVVLAWACNESSGASPIAGKKSASLPPSCKRVVFLGDSITYAGMYVDFIEAYFLTRHPERSIEFIDLGLPSETVSGLTEEGHAGGQFPRPDLHERLARIMDQAKPDLIFACYGMNDGIYMPLDEQRFAKFREGIEWLHQQANQAGAKIIHVTPPTFDEVKGGHAGYSAVLGKYSDWLSGKVSEARWDVVDLHRPMDAYLAQRRKTEPDFAYASDGVHANAIGHWIMARQILLHLGAQDINGCADENDMLAGHPHGKEVLKLVHQRQDLMKNSWLTSTGHKRPGMAKGLPFSEAKSKAAAIEKEIHELLKQAK